MKERQCEVIRRELDELVLGDECSTAATQHLRDCGECREFHQKQTRLRQIVGSLGTVEAPADFDFRLRARLANESSSAGFHLRAFQWSSATKGLAATAMLLVFVGGVVYVRTVVNGPATPTTEVTVQQDQPVKPPVKPVDDKVVAPVETPQVALDNAPRKIRGGERQTAPRPKRAPVAIDFSSERPQTFSNSSRHSAIFPIDASVQSFTVSLEDGRGNARTISLPTITFGSQRVIPTTANQFTQKSVW
ncbi:MAG TPA: hypothetical protein VFS77_21940 [Pyrinomonadaceae bacterium]|nr:hypothetical protein [Pyrinomonadaceae bacterium]